jgi:integrase
MAEDEARRIQAERAVPKGGDPNDVTLEAFTARWYEFLRSRGRSEETIATAKSLMRTHWIPKLGQQRVSTITPADINRVLDVLPGKLSTLQRSRGALASCFDYAWRLGLCTENPVKRSFAPVGEPTRKRRPPTSVEVDRAHAYALETWGPAMGLAIRLAADTGARRGELAALRWSDVDLSTGVVVIARSMSTAGGKRIEKGTKTGSIKTLQVTGPTLTALAEQWERLTAWHPEPQFVVADDPLEGWLPDRIGATWAKVADEVGIPEVHLHDLRHRFVSTLLSAGMAVTDVAGLAGHSKPTVTLNTYGHDSNTAAAEAAMILGKG